MNISRPSRNHVGVTIDINLAPFKKFHCNFLQRMFTLNDCIRNVPYILRNCIKQFQLFRNTLNVKNYYRNDLLKKKAIITRLEDRFQDLYATIVREANCTTCYDNSKIFLPSIRICNELTSSASVSSLFGNRNDHPTLTDIRVRAFRNTFPSTFNIYCLFNDITPTLTSINAKY